MVELFSITLFLIGLYRPLFLLLVFIAFANIESSLPVLNYLGYGHLLTDVVTINKYIIIFLGVQLLSNKSNIFAKSNDKRFSNSIFFSSIIIFSMYSFIGIFYVDIDYENVLSDELRRLFNFLMMTLILYLKINDIKQIKLFLLIGIFFDFFKSVSALGIFYLTGEQIVIGSSIPMVVFSISYLIIQKTKKLKFLGILLFIIPILIVLLSGSRRSMIGIVIALFFVIKEKSSLSTLKPIIFAILFLFFSSNYLNLDLFSSKLNQSIVLIKSVSDDSIEVRNAWSGRNKLWSYAWEAIKEKPIWGFGFGTNTEVISIYSFANKKARVHNAYLKIWLELGLVGLLITIFLFLNYFLILKRQYLFSTYLNDNLLSSLVFASYISMIVTVIVGIFGWSAFHDKSLWLSFTYALSVNKIFSNSKHLLSL